jgi:hypothetical protein
MLSAAAANFFLLPPRESFYVESAADVVKILVFIIEAFFYVILITEMRLSLERYRELSRNLEQGVEERSAEQPRASRGASRRSHILRPWPWSVFQATSSAAQSLSHRTHLLADRLGAVRAAVRMIGSGTFEPHVLLFVDFENDRKPVGLTNSHHGCSQPQHPGVAPCRVEILVGNDVQQ